MDTIGRYSVLKDEAGGPIKFGQGPWVTTYKAFSNDLRCYVALKMIPRDAFSSEEDCEQFVSEVRMAANIRHRSLASVFPLELTEDSYLYAMEFCDGETLADCAARSAGLETLAMLNIGSQIAAALDAASSAGLLHRNITADSIMLLQEDDEISAKLLGLALPARGVLRNDPVPPDDCDFRSPEEVSGQPTDMRSGIYSLGALLYYIEAGSERYALLRAKSLANQDDLFEDAENLSSRIVVIAKATLRRDPTERIQTFAELRDMIDGVIKAPKQSNIDHAAISARPDGGAKTEASPSAEPLPELDIPAVILPVEVTPKTARRGEGELMIPAELLGVGQAGTVLTLKRVEADLGEKVIARVGTSFRIGRLATADLVTRFLPRNTANDTKTRRLSKIHVTCKWKGDQILLTDGDGARPSANGSTFDSTTLSPKTRIALVKPGELRLGNAYTIKVVPLIARNNDAPAIANVGDWRGPIAESNLTVGGAILFLPGDSVVADLAIWLFSVAEFGSSSASYLDFAMPSGEPKIGALHYYRGCFWIENKSADALLVDGFTLASAEIAPLVTGQTVEINGRKYSVEIEELAKAESKS